MNTLSPEVKLLLLCCMGVPDTDRLLQITQQIHKQPIDWNRLLILSRVHRVDPLLYRTLSLVAGPPEAVVDQLLAAYRHSTLDSLLKQQQYNRINRTLNRCGIRHLWFKGIYLAEYAYPERNWRPVGDLDLLIDSVSIRNVSTQLEALAYRLGDSYTPYLRYPDTVMIRDLHELSLFKTHSDDSQFDVDVQWRIDCFSPFFRSFTLEDFSHPRYPVENQVVLLVIHHGVNNCWKRISYVNDLYYLLRAGSIDWSWLLNRVRQYDLELLLLTGLHWCRQGWAMPVPDDVDQLLTIHRARVRELARLGEQHWDDSRETTPVEAGYYMIRSLSKSQVGIVRKLRVYQAYTRSFLFRPKFVRINQQVIYCSRWLSLLSAPWRLVRFAYRRLS